MHTCSIARAVSISPMSISAIIAPSATRSLSHSVSFLFAFCKHIGNHYDRVMSHNVSKGCMKFDHFNIHQPKRIFWLSATWSYIKIQLTNCLYLSALGLWKGLTPRIIMIGTLTALQWFIYDAVKVWLRLPRPPPPEMPESLKKKLAAKQQ